MACIYRRRLLDIQMIVVIVEIPIGKMPTVVRHLWAIV